MNAMDKEKFRELLTDTYGHRPYYFRTDAECQIMRAKKPAAMANDDCIGKGLKPFYLGRKAAYLTPELIELAVQRFTGAEPT